ARGDHAAAPLVVLQPARGVVLVAHGHCSTPRADGCQARDAPAGILPARRTVAGAPRAGQPPISPGSAPVLAQDLPVEELLHRRGRLPQGGGAPRAPAPSSPRGGGGAAVARGAARRARRPR